MSLFSLGSWIAEERKRARKEWLDCKLDCSERNRHCDIYLEKLAILRRLSARLRRGR